MCLPFFSIVFPNKSNRNYFLHMHTFCINKTSEHFRFGTRQQFFLEEKCSFGALVVLRLDFFIIGAIYPLSARSTNIYDFFFRAYKFPPEQNGMAAHVHACVHTFISIDRDNYQRLSHNDVILFKSIVQSIR